METHFKWPIDRRLTTQWCPATAIMCPKFMNELAQQKKKNVTFRMFFVPTNERTPHMHRHFDILRRHE